VRGSDRAQFSSLVFALAADRGRVNPRESAEGFI
jgi:hypothetical protein